MSRLARTKTARDILEALADGRRDPKALAALAAGQVKGGREAVEHGLEGMLPGDHHPLLIRVHLDHITFLDRSIAAVEDEIDAALDAIPAAGASAPTASHPRSPDRAPRPASGETARGDPRRQPQSSPRRSSPRPAWT